MSVKTFCSWIFGLAIGSMGAIGFTCAAIETKTGREALAVTLAIAFFGLAALSAAKLQLAYEAAMNPCNRPHKM